MATSTASRKNFITRDHRYVYLGGSFIALLGLSMFYSAPSPYSFIPAQSVFGTALAAICWFFLGVSAMALLVKWAYWNNYSSTIMKRPLIVRVSRYLSYLDAAACALLVLDRFILKLAYIINAAIHADSNPTDTLSTMAYMAYNQRSLFAIGISYTVRRALRHGDRVRAGASHGLPPHSGARQTRQRLCEVPQDPCQQILPLLYLRHPRHANDGAVADPL